MEAWIGFGGALLGALIGGGTTFFVMKQQFSYQTTEKKRKHRLQRLESTYETATEMRHIYREAFGKITSFLALQQKWGEWKNQGTLPDQKLTMLVSLYCPEMAHHLSVIDTTTKELSTQFVRCLNATDSPGSQSVVLKEFTAVYDKVDLALSNFQKELARLAVQYV